MKQRFNTNAGSLQNLLMSNNDSTPVVGEYATIMHYTDRSICLVRQVTGKEVIVEQVRCDYDEAGYGIPSTFENTGYNMTLVYRHKAWRQKSKVIYFTPEFLKKADEAGMMPVVYLKRTDPNMFSVIYQGQVMPQVAVDGITVAKNEYSRVRILFGSADAYYDRQF